MLQDKNIILFDGECDFCSFWVKFVIQRDKKDVFRFASLQSDIGKKILAQYQIDNAIDSVVFIQKNKAFIKSTATLQILKTMGGLRSVIFVFIIIPRFIRDFFYDLIAKYRYLFFRQNSCQLINQNNIKHKFLS